MLALSTTVVVPVLNGEAHVAELAERVANVARGAEAGIELLFVNDGSTDGSWDAIRSVAAEHSFCGGLDLARRSGQHAALLRGAIDAVTEAVVTVDDDLVHPPEFIPMLVAALANGADLAYGTPLDRGPIGLRRFGSFAARAALGARFRARSALRSSPFRAFRRSLLDPAPHQVPVEPNLDALVYRARPRVASVPYEPGAAPGAPSRYTLRSLVRATAAVVRDGRKVNLDTASEVRMRIGTAALPLSDRAFEHPGTDRADPAVARR